MLEEQYHLVHHKSVCVPMCVCLCVCVCWVCQVLFEGYTSIAITLKEQHHMVGQKCEATSKVFSSKYNTQHLYLCFTKFKLQW